eukprot:gene2228-biopygen14031
MEAWESRRLRTTLPPSYPLSAEPSLLDPRRCMERETIGCRKRAVGQEVLSSRCHAQAGHAERERRMRAHLRRACATSHSRGALATITRRLVCFCSGTELDFIPDFLLYCRCCGSGGPRCCRAAPGARRAPAAAPPAGAVRSRPAAPLPPPRR